MEVTTIACSYTTTIIFCYNLCILYIYRYSNGCLFICPRSGFDQRYLLIPSTINSTFSTISNKKNLARKKKKKNNKKSWKEKNRGGVCREGKMPLTHDPLTRKVTSNIFSDVFAGIRYTSFIKVDN